MPASVKSCLGRKYAVPRAAEGTQASVVMSPGPMSSARARRISSRTCGWSQRSMVCGSDSLRGRCDTPSPQTAPPGLLLEEEPADSVDHSERRRGDVISGGEFQHRAEQGIQLGNASML